MTRDSRISFPYLIDRWNDYRASHIRESYAANLELDTSLFQDLAAVPVTLRSLQDDPMFPSGCMNLGKASIPSVVSMVNNTGIISVSDLSKNRKYQMCHITELADRMRLENYKDEHWYAKLGNTLWVYPYRKEINVVAILNDPLEGWVINTELPVNGFLIRRTEYQNGESYRVTGGTIIHGGTQYGFGDVFEAIETGWTGNGTIEFVNKKRKMTVEDPYPMSATMVKIIMVEILTIDFRLSKQQVADIGNDMKDDALAATAR